MDAFIVERCEEKKVPCLKNVFTENYCTIEVINLMGNVLEVIKGKVLYLLI